MTPLEIQIALHYYTTSTDFRDGDFSAPAVRKTIDSFLELGLLVPTPPSEELYGTYQSTSRLSAYVRHLMEQPLPVQQWVVPEAKP